MNERNEEAGRRSRRPPFAGLLLIALGALFLAGTLGAIDIGTLVRRWWPGLLVLVGLERLLLASSHHAGGITLVAIGSVMLAFTLGGLSWDWVGRYWPVILIGLGLWIVLKPRR